MLSVVVACWKRMREKMRGKSKLQNSQTLVFDSHPALIFACCTNGTYLELDLLLFVSAVHFALYLTGLSSMMLI